MKLALLTLVAILSEVTSGQENETMKMESTPTTPSQSTTTIKFMHNSSPTFHEECDTYTLTDSAGNFTSPNYPYQYPNEQECVWNIRLEDGFKIELYISKIDIEYGENCSNDFLEVFDGPDINSPRLVQICDEKEDSNDTVVRSSSNSLTVAFFSDYRWRFGGFVVNYTSYFDGKVLQKGGDEKWFKLKDDPKAEKVKKALMGSKKTYSGLAKQSVTFHIEGKKKFFLKEGIITTRYNSAIDITYYVKKKGGLEAVLKTVSIQKSTKWTETKFNFKKKIEKLSIKLTWDSSLQGSKKEKIQVKDLKIVAVLKN